jgi:hypothetical protein
VSPIPPWENPPSYLAPIRVRGVSLAKSTAWTSRLKRLPRRPKEPMQRSSVTSTRRRAVPWRTGNVAERRYSPANVGCTPRLTRATYASRACGRRRSERRRPDCSWPKRNYRSPPDAYRVIVRDDHGADARAPNPAGKPLQAIVRLSSC